MGLGYAKSRSGTRWRREVVVGLGMAAWWVGRDGWDWALWWQAEGRQLSLTAFA